MKLNESIGKMDKKEYDVAVIGAGPGGYTAAIRTAQRGKKTVLIEKKKLGGVCLNVGCIPTKALAAGADHFRKLKHSRKYGISADMASFDFSEMTARKDRIVEKMGSSLRGLIQTNAIEILSGTASFESSKELKVLGNNPCRVKAQKIIIATGSQPADISAFPADHKKILNSTSALKLTKLPKSMIIIGGGYIGCEFASMYREMGVDITIVEATERLLPGIPLNVAESLRDYFLKERVEIFCERFVETIDTEGEGVSVHLRDGDTLKADLALVAVGRAISTGSLKLEKIGVVTGSRREILVDDQMRTSVPGIYAIGDVTGKAMLAHVASHQALVAAEHIVGRDVSMEYQTIPAVVYTYPEIGVVGLGKEEAVEAGHEVITGKMPFMALGKAAAISETYGFAEIVADRTTGEILGAQAIGYDSANLIAEMALAMKNELTLACIYETIHAHPSFGEVWMEAALLASGYPVNFPPPKKRA
ncbi:MAG: dihydrolipoyl dehydrogenase [Chlamydiota bacterium]